MTSNGHDSGKPLRIGDPSELDGYRLVSRLGRGGMGTVYLARDASDRLVAVKLIHPDLADDESFRLRFAREVEAARRVARFSTAGVIDARLEGEPLLIVSEFVPGPNLDEAIRTDGPMAGGTLDSLAMGVAAALTAIHGSGVIHRDLKPANVLLSPVGPKVIDFGIARALDDAGGAVTRSSQLMGTPSYMAPELLLGQTATAAADIFAWGCLVAFAGIGSAPFDAATVPAVLHNISSAPPRLDGLDPSLYDLVNAALDKDPANRPSSKQLLARLTGQEDPEEAEVRRTISTSWAPPSSAPVSRQPPREAQEWGVESTAHQAPSEPRHSGATPPEGHPTQAQGPTHPYTRPTQFQPYPETPPTIQPPQVQQQPIPGGPFGPSGPQQVTEHGGHPPQGPVQGQPPVQGQQGPGHHGNSSEQAPPTQQMHGAPPSPPQGQPAFATHSGPGSPGGPGHPPGGTPSGRSRGRVLGIGAGVVAVVLVAAVGTAVLLNRAEAIPEDTVSIYNTDFSTDPGWVHAYDQDFEDDGYWAEQRGVLLTLDPDLQPTRGEVVALDREEELPDGVLVSSSAYVVDGPEQGWFGVRCWDNEGEEQRTQYAALLRYDGQGAEILRDNEEEGDRTLAETTEVSSYEPYPAFDASLREEYGYQESAPLEFDAGEVPTNTITFACDFDEAEDVMELTMWVNEDHVLTAVDEEPLPDDAEEPTGRRRVGITTRQGWGNDPLSVLFTDFELHQLTEER